MTGRRAAVSIFITWHLIAITLSALPRPRGSTIYRWLIAPVDLYISATGLAQRWGMFANPPQFDQYIRVRYYLEPGDGGRQWMVTELVMPAHREDRVRLLQSYRDSYLDKAFSIALEDFYRRRARNLVRPDVRPVDLPDDLAPIGRYYSRQFASRLGEGGARIVRTETWVGTADTPPPPKPTAPPLERRAALQAYYDGPIEERFRVAPYPPYHAAEKEADITWVLEYFEEP